MLKQLPRRQHGELDRIAWAKTALLLGMGVYFTWLILSGNLSNYINQRFAWLAVLGAAVFILLALVNLYGSLAGDAECGHQHYEIGWEILLIAALPLLLALLIPSRSLGIEAVNGGISLSPVGVASPAAFQRSPLDRNILDWLREFDRASSPAAFNGTAADVIGFIYREPSFSDEQFMLSRFTMSCCVADAFPIGMPVSAPEAPDTGAWVRVQGELAAADFGGDFMPSCSPIRLRRSMSRGSPIFTPNRRGADMKLDKLDFAVFHLGRCYAWLASAIAAYLGDPARQASPRRLSLPGAGSRRKMSGCRISISAGNSSN